MRRYRRYWYIVGFFIALAAIVFALALTLETVQRILLLNFAALLLHQYEEYGWPCGGPALLNKVLRPVGDRPDRYPLNQNSAMVTNVLAAYPFYLLPVFFPQIVWLGLAPVLFGFFQVILHGVAANIRLKSLYNPGMATALFGHLPLGIWYLVEVNSQHVISGWDWVIGIVYALCFIVVIIGVLTYVVLADRNSPYPFAPEEMNGWVDRRVARLAQAQDE
jgi:Protein of unknown function with HXXEE motif